MIRFETALEIARAYQEKETAEKLLEDVKKVLENAQLIGRPFDKLIIGCEIVGAYNARK